MKDVTKDELDKLVTKLTNNIASSPSERYPAPSGPAPASQDPVLLPGEPILHEVEGWGIYNEAEISRQGDVLTHIGCDCAFVFWSIAIEHAPRPTFHCSECGESLSDEAYERFSRVYKFLNNQNNQW